MVSKQTNACSSVNDYRTNVYNSEADLQFTQTSKCIYA